MAVPPAPSEVVIAASVPAVGIAQLPAPAAGSSATMARVPPWYGSETAVQPPAVAARYPPPFMNLALTCWPAAVVNGPELVSLAWNGLAHAAFRYSASVSTHPMPFSEPGGSSCGMCPRVAAATAWLISWAARSGLLSNGTWATPAS